ncbi:hypothetical protein ACFV9P_33530 [Streptomyces sp. NPDC059892]|uniref:AfsR/SARP family transcriptional regulator n=1 Tax=unclassified Streptomyces TaxID=2593676 RepID=UPI003642A02D
MAHLRFSLLGPLRILRDGVPLAAGYPQEQAMLAALLLRPGRVAGAADLSDALWGTTPPAKACRRCGRTPGAGGGYSRPGSRIWTYS